MAPRFAPGAAQLAQLSEDDGTWSEWRGADGEDPTRADWASASSAGGEDAALLAAFRARLRAAATWVRAVERPETGIVASFRAEMPIARLLRDATQDAAEAAEAEGRRRDGGRNAPPAQPSFEEALTKRAVAWFAKRHREVGAGWGLALCAPSTVGGQRSSPRAASASGKELASPRAASASGDELASPRTAPPSGDELVSPRTAPPSGTERASSPTARTSFAGRSPPESSPLSRLPAPPPFLQTALAFYACARAAGLRPRLVLDWLRPRAWAEVWWPAMVNERVLGRDALDGLSKTYGLWDPAETVAPLHEPLEDALGKAPWPGARPGRPPLEGGPERSPRPRSPRPLPLVPSRVLGRWAHVDPARGAVDRLCRFDDPETYGALSAVAVGAGHVVALDDVYRDGPRFARRVPAAVRERIDRALDETARAMRAEMEERERREAEAGEAGGGEATADGAGATRGGEATSAQAGEADNREPRPPRAAPASLDGGRQETSPRAETPPCVPPLAAHERVMQTCASVQAAYFSNQDRHNDVLRDLRFPEDDEKRLDGRRDGLG